MKFMRSSNVAASLAISLAVFSSTLLSQSDNASISGVVKDASGALVADARVTLKDERTTQEKRNHDQ